MKNKKTIIIVTFVVLALYSLWPRLGNHEDRTGSHTINNLQRVTNLIEEYRNDYGQYPPNAKKLDKFVKSIIYKNVGIGKIDNSFDNTQVEIVDLDSEPKEGDKYFSKDVFPGTLLYFTKKTKYGIVKYYAIYAAVDQGKILYVRSGILSQSNTEININN
jgi:hypothetical protein